MNRLFQKHSRLKRDQGEKRRQLVRSLTIKRNGLKATGRQKRQNNSVGKPKCAGETGINKEVIS